MISHPDNLPINIVITEPVKTYECAEVYMNEHVFLKPYESVLLKMSSTISSKFLDMITLSHRSVVRNESHERQREHAYSRVRVRDRKGKEWLTWGVKYYGRNTYFGDKLAEVRDQVNPEVEALHDWVNYSGLIYPEYIMITNTGESDNAVLCIHELRIDVIPEGSTQQEIIITPHTEFANIKKRNKEQFGGGIEYQGNYPFSVPLGIFKEAISFPVSRSGKNYSLDRLGNLHVLVDKSYVFSRIEVAVGDTHATGEINKDGHFGTLGSAKLTLALRKKNESSQKTELLTNANVPPQGVLKASPIAKTKLVKGDEFIISVEHDNAYVMGVRIQ
ncbi:MAG: hypothetical protein NUV98_04245 [Candidatus Roizmanbacteria bacterium]|nr:hypothetical protein [Candidatus Roizmanbacteria bacterium]